MHKKLVRAALILSLTIVFQSLRMIMPIPPLFTTFVIGSLVNMCIIIAYLQTGLRTAIVICLVAPMIALWQGVLPFFIFALPIMLGNVIYVVVFRFCQSFHWFKAASLAAVGKTIVVYMCFYYLVLRISLPLPIVKSLMYAMSWPQLVTAIAGVALAYYLNKRLSPIK